MKNTRPEPDRTAAGELAALRTDLEKGLADIAAGRTSKFDHAEIIRCGRERLKRRNVTK